MSSSAPADVNYTLDKVGNPLTETRTGASSSTFTYGYDAMDRLTSVCFQAGTCPGGSDPFIRWDYDGVGNRLTETRPAGTTSYSYDSMDRMLTAGATSYTYDRNGNQLSAGSRTFTWDLANRLKTTTASGTTTTYTYDGDGVRLQASTGSHASAKTNFAWDVNNALPMLAREDNGNGQLQRRYIYGHRAIFLSTSASNAFYYHYDPLGSVRYVTSSTGATQLTYDYEPYGSVRTSTGSSPTNLLKFTGEYHDPTSLYHLRARQYDPSAGAFLSVDPVATEQREPRRSAYLYADDRPVHFVDPSGEGAIRPAREGIEYTRGVTSTIAAGTSNVARHPLPRSRRFYTDSASGSTKIYGIEASVPPKVRFLGKLFLRFSAGLNGQQLKVFTGARQLSGRGSLSVTVELRCGRSKSESDSSCFNDTAIQNLQNRDVDLRSYFSAVDREYAPSLYWEVRERGVRTLRPARIEVPLPNVYCGRRLSPRCYFFRA